MFIVPRTWIFGCSSVLWMAPAALLISRAFFWIQPLETPVFLLSVALTAGATTAGYVFGFRRIVQKNIGRIHALPSKAGLWRVSSPGGYGIVATMVLLGITLRSTDIPRLFLAGPYATMGGCLFLGSLHMGRVFLLEILESRSRA